MYKKEVKKSKKEKKEVLNMENMNQKAIWSLRKKDLCEKTALKISNGLLYAGNKNGWLGA